jgi:plasmid stabilization system protein ParE
MPTDLASFHEEASAEYDAAFEWYLERSPDAALKFDAEVGRAIAQITQFPQRWRSVRTLLAGSCSNNFPLF